MKRENSPFLRDPASLNKYSLEHQLLVGYNFHAHTQLIRTEAEDRMNHLLKGVF